MHVLAGVVGAVICTWTCALILKFLFVMAIAVVKTAWQLATLPVLLIYSYIDKTQRRERAQRAKVSRQLRLAEGVAHPGWYFGAWAAMFAACCVLYLATHF